MTAWVVKKLNLARNLVSVIGCWVLVLCPQAGWGQTVVVAATPVSPTAQTAAKFPNQTPMAATAVAGFPSANGLGTAPAAGTGSTSSTNSTGSNSQSSFSTNDFSLSPQEEAKILNVIDAEENTSTVHAVAKTTAPSIYTPPPVPTGISVIVLKEGVYLSWNTAPAGSNAAGYNIYRSSKPGYGYRQMNMKPLTAAYFLDGPPNSADNPQNGEDYFYVVASVDGSGNVSPYSDEMTVYPSGMEIPESMAEQKAYKLATEQIPEEEKVLNVPEQSVISIKLPADSQLAIQGYKKVDAQIAFQTYNRLPVNGLSNQVNTTTINQELVVNLKGKVGSNVDVNVDYSDVNRAGGVDQTKQDISIVYHGNADSAVQQVSFGDLQLTLPNTEFAGFSKQLFGLEAVFKLDRFRFTTFFAQTKGIAVTKVFTGNTTQIDKTYQDISFVPYKYFLITRASGTGLAPTGSALPQNNTEQIWVNNGTQQLNPIGPNFLGYWEHWLPGRDYTIDYSTGIITFIRALSSSSQIAVGFNDQTGAAHGLNALSPPPNPPAVLNGSGSTLAVPDSGYVDSTHFLIKDSTVQTDLSSTSSIILSPLYLVDYFSTGTDKIVPPNQDPGFLFQVVSQGTNNIIQTGQGGSTAAPYAYNLNLDLNVLTVTNTNFIDPAGGPYLYFPERPFANPDGTSNGTVVVQAAGTGVTDVYAPASTTPTSLYYIHLKYKTQLSVFKLDNINVLRGSDTVYLDGRLLTRDKDYFIDYTTGFLDFQDKSLLTPSSQIVVTYEYSPFGSFGANNILGARAEYAVTDNFFIGSTFLESDSQQPTDTPQIGSTPNSLTLFDADAKYEMSPDDLQSITGIIPGLEKWKPPATLKLSGEIAQSYFDPDTYNARDEQGVNENGVAMVDNMAGINSAVAASLNQTSWLVSSAPAYNYVNPGTVLSCAVGPNNNRTRFYNDVISPNVDFMVNTSTAIPGGGGHVYAQTGQAGDVVNVLQFPYAHLNNQSWAGLRQVISTAGTDFSTVQFFQTWLYNDGKSKWIMFDFGVVNESSNGDSLLDSDAVTNQANPNQAYGIPTFYMQGTPWFDTGNPPGNFNFATDAGGQPGGLIGLNGEVSQEGQNNGVYITQNMNGTGVLNTTDSYFEYGVQANWTGWQLVKIPVVSLTSAATDYQATTPSGISYFFHNQGGANSLVIRTLRLWVTGASNTTIDGTFLTDSISFTHNLWQLEVDPAANASLGVTINSSKFDVNSISEAQNANYTPDMSFIVIQPGQDQSAIQFNEQALDITYQLSSADYNPPGNINGTPIYYATKVFQQGLDFTDYQELRMDMQIRNYNSGEIFFVRIGNDQQDYYQYNLTMNSLAANCLNNWGTVIIPLSGSGGNMIQVGTPFINRASQISFGVLSPNPPSGRSGEIWITNLRSTTPNVRSGTARRLNAELVLGEDPKKPFATIDARYREVDSGFTEMDQTSTHFQHSLQYGLDYTSNGISLFGQPLQSQFSLTDQELYTEAALANNPYYFDLPNSQIDTATGSVRYTKDLGKDIGRLTSLNLSGSLSSENDVYQSNYLDQPGVQGNTTKSEEQVSLISTYDMPTKLWFLPIGANQLTETLSFTHDEQNFDSYTDLANYERTTRVQNYGWSNTTEVFKNLVFTPGFNISLTDAKGNTDSPGVYAGTVDDYVPFIQQYQPKAGLVFRGIPGIIPSVTYTGSNQYDYVDYPDGTRYTNSNNVNYSVNVTPGSWLPFFQKMNLTIFAGETDSSTASIPGYSSNLSFEQQWGITSPGDIQNIALLGTESKTDQLNASFKLFDVWDFRPTGSWTNQYSLLYQGSNPVQQTGDTVGLTTIYNRKLFTLPWINFSVNSVQLQYTRTDSTQYDSSTPPLISNQIYSNIYSVTFPYEINKLAQGNMRFQATIGYQNGLATTNIPAWSQDYQGSFEYDQKFAPNLILHIPLTHWKILLHDAIEFKANFLTEVVQNDSQYTYNQLETQRYRGTIEFDYNALKNLRFGLTGINEYFTNELNPTLSYVLWQINLSGEAKF